VVFVGVGTSRVVLLRHTIVKSAAKGDVGEENVFAYCEVAEKGVISPAKCTIEFPFQESEIILGDVLTIEGEAQLDFRPVVIETVLITRTPGIDPHEITGGVEGDGIGVDPASLRVFAFFIRF
jgi:hypothetical protein